VGIVLEEDKHYLFESRLAPIVRQLGLGSINDLCAPPGHSQSEVGQQVVEAMTTNETYFFRDPAQYEAIRTVLLPAEGRAAGYEEAAVLVGRGIDRAGSLQPGHASLEEGLERLEHSNPGHRLFLEGFGTRPVRQVPAD
jgi:hypothetical protein